MATIKLSEWKAREGITTQDEFHEVLRRATFDSVCPALCDEGCEVEPDGPRPDPRWCTLCRVPGARAVLPRGERRRYDVPAPALVRGLRRARVDDRRQGR